MQNFWAILPALLLGLAVLYAAWHWWRRRKNAPYDLRRLQDARYEGWPAPEEEPEEALITEDSGPYCILCDEAYPAGTTFCRHCRRSF